MQLYRFSPIQEKEQLLEAIKYTHFACYKLCKQSFGDYLPNAGNIGIFCHYDKEYERLKTIQKGLCEMSDDFNQKYFRLQEPIVIQEDDEVPGTTYTYLYIRQPDPYRYQVGDLDFYIKPEEFSQLKQALLDGTSTIEGARAFDRTDLDMVELYDPDIDVLAYVATHKMTGKVI